MPRLDFPPEDVDSMMDYLSKEHELSTGSNRVGILFSAIRLCGDQEIPMPEWVVNAFYTATNEWFGMRACSLDEAFGAETKTPKRLAQRRLKRAGYFQTRIMVYEAKQRNVPIDVSLFESIGREIGLSKTVVQELYYGPRKRGALSREKPKKRGITKK